MKKPKCKEGGFTTPEKPKKQKAKYKKGDKVWLASYEEPMKGGRIRIRSFVVEKVNKFTSLGWRSEYETIQEPYFFGLFTRSKEQLVFVKKPTKVRYDYLVTVEAGVFQLFPESSLYPTRKALIQSI